MESRRVLNSEEIQAIIPHRPPFLFVDRIIEIDQGHTAVGVLADLSRSEYFGEVSTVPNTILIEALAEVGAVGALSLPANQGKLALLTAVDDWTFSETVAPGAYVELRAELVQMRGSYGRARVRVVFEERTVAEGLLSFAIVDRENALS
jgi:3-hydroxyacyl-[acyl-carrier-protein] dehydratase